MEDATRLRLRGASPAAARLAAVALAAALTLAAAPPDSAGRAERARELLAAAHAAAGEDRHAEAVDKAFAAIGLDPSLGDEAALLIAYQLTWMERAAEAIPWYRRHLAQHPGDREGTLGLARALSWAGRLEEAQETYAGRLEGAPQDLEARLGVARMLAWREDHRGAVREYEAILVAHPESREARRGLAAAENARGRHRRAVAIYQELLREDPGDSAARAGLARAHRWTGRHDLAEEVLQAAAGEEVEGERRALAAERRPTVDVFGSFYTDVDDQDLATYGVRWEWAGRARWGTFAEFALERAEEPVTGDVDLQRLTVGGSWATAASAVFHFRLTGAHQTSDGRDVDVGGGEVVPSREVEFTAFLWDGWLTWAPADWTRVDLGHARVHVPIPRSLARRIRIDLASVGITRRLTDRIVLRAGASFGDYTDGNTRWAGSSELEIGPWPRLPAHIGLGAEGFTFDESPDHGYFSPGAYDAFFGSVAYEWSAGRHWRIAVESRLSSERESGSGRFGVLTGGGEVRWRASGLPGLLLFARKSTSRFDTSAGYEREGVGLSLFVGP